MLLQPVQWSELSNISDQPPVSYLLKLSSSGIVSRCNFEIGSSEDPTGDRDKEEDQRDDGVRFQGENEKCRKSEAPHDQIKRNDSVVRRIGCSPSVCPCESESGKVQHAEAKPENREEAHYHHLHYLSRLRLIA